MLTGSDPSDIQGCCPSSDVAAANRLVEAGILQSWQPPSPPDACPRTIYAFNREILAHENDKPSFQENNDLRQTVLHYLEQLDTPARKILVTCVRLLLLLFVAASVLYAFLGRSERTHRHHAQISDNDIFNAGTEHLPRNAVVVYYFYGAETCRFCDNMKNYTKRAMQTHFRDQLLNGKLVFKEINKDDPANRALKKQYGVFTSSVMLADIRDGKEERRKLLADAWHLTGSEEEFVEMIKKELTAFMENN